MKNAAPVHSPPSTAAPRMPWTLLVVGAGSVLSALDLFVVNLAFASIRDSFPGATNQSLSWVLSAYSIVFAALLVPAGRLADRYGRKQVFQLGLLVFALASLGCALAPGVLSLILARGLKGVGAALMIPTSLGLLLAASPPERHKQMVSLWAATGSVAAALGPVLGGLLVQLDWRLIFLINLPVALPALGLSRHLVETPRHGADLPDVVGSVFLAAGIGCVVAVISYVTDWGLSSRLFWATLAAGGACLAVFVWRCLHEPSPALDLRVFRIPAFTIATLGMACFYTGFAMNLLGGTLFLTQVWHWDTAKTGVAFGLGPGTAVVAALVGGRARIAPRGLTLIGGMLVLLAGLWWFAFLGETPEYFTRFLPGLLLTGAGAGVAQTGFLSSGAAALPPSDYATGTGILNTARQMGAAVGVALLVAVSGTALRATQYVPVWLLISGFGLTSILAALALRPRPEVSPPADA
jgi:EmrB/QacA subfamily drug resistance transporter